MAMLAVVIFTIMATAGCENTPVCHYYDNIDRRSDPLEQKESKATKRAEPESAGSGLVTNELASDP
jgi:hypothetical protein